MDKARQSVFESEPLNAGEAAFLTVSLRKGALDLYTELALVKSWEVAAPSLGGFRKYLSKSEGQRLLCEGNFACYCPLCRGEAGVHYIRVFDLACNLYAAVYTVRQATEHNRDLLREPITDYFHKAVRFLRQGAEKLTSISWKATDPLRDLLHQYASRYPDPALNLIDELLYYFQHGRWREPQRKVAATFPLADDSDDGAIAKLVLERTDALVPGFYPHPKLLLATRWNQEFAEQFVCAWENHTTDKTAALRWNLEPYRSEGRVWNGNPIGGPSVGAAVGVALKCIEDPNLPPPHIDCALTGKLEPNGSLGSVGGYLRKSLPISRYRDLNIKLIIPSCDAPIVQAEIPDWQPHLLPADDLNQALQHAIQLPEAVRAYLEQLIATLDDTRIPLYLDGEKLTNRRLFTPLRLLIAKPRRPEENGRRPSERGESDAQKEKPSNVYAELQSQLYELTREHAQKEEIRWDEFERRVLHEKRTALIGAPGGGKTFGTRHLAIKTALQALQQLNEGKPLDEICIPFWLPAAKLGETGNLRDAIAQLLPSLPRAWLDNILDNILEKGSFLLVIDALDELRVSQQAKFQTCVQRIGVQQGEGQQDDGKVGVQQGEDQQKDGKVDIQQGDGKKRIVLVTCRTMHWEGRSRWLGWEKLPDAVELAPLNPREQRAIAERFFGKGAAQAQAIQQRLRESYVLRHACHTPLLLTFACLLQSENQLRSDLTYAQLYARILRYLMQGKWRNVAEPLAASDMGEERALRQLETIAWNLFRQSPESNLFTLDEWCSAGSNASSTPLAPAELLEKLERVGVVVSAGYDDVREDRQWSFAHRSILEFLAARCLSRQPNWLDEISQHFWFQPEWVEVLTFLAGLVENADPLVERLEQEQDDLFGSMLLLQARVVGFGRVSDAVAQRITARAVQRYLHSKMTRQFTQPALQALGRHAVPHLAKALQDEYYGVRRAACEALGEIGDPQAIPHLIQALQDEDARVRKAACEALGRIGDPQAIPPLLQALKDEDSYVREAACKALWRISVRHKVPIRAS